MAKRTRSATQCDVLGPPAVMPVNQLPTCSDVLRRCNLTRNELKSQNNNKEPSFFVIAGIVAKKIEALWQKASLPMVSHDRVVQLIKNRHEKYRNLLRSHKRRKGSETHENNTSKFLSKSDALFDICTCKCEGVSCNCVVKKGSASREGIPTRST